MNLHALGVAGCVAGLVGCTASAQIVPPPPAVPGCAQDLSVVGCQQPATGYSCGNGESPEQSDPSLVCSVGNPSSDGFVLYCCIQFASSTCAEDPNVQGCRGASFGFSCTGADTPDQADSTLVCSSATAGGDGALLYCCTD